MFAFPFAWPIANELAPTMNYYIREAISQGAWEALLTKYEPKQECGDYRIQGSGPSTGLPKITPLMLLGPIMVLFASTVMACIVRVFGAKVVESGQHAISVIKSTVVDRASTNAQEQPETHQNWMSTLKQAKSSAVSSERDTRGVGALPGILATRPTGTVCSGLRPNRAAAQVVPAPCEPEC